MLSIIAVVAENNAIGKDNNLLCKVPGDLKRFKTITTGHKIVMGRKTFESFPNGPLPDRENIVLTGNPEYNPEGCTIINDSSEIDKYIESDEEVFIIGGAQVYKMFIDKAKKMYLTHLHKVFNDADSFFPDFDSTEWNKIFEEDHSPESVDFTFTYVDYIRKN